MSSTPLTEDRYVHDLGLRDLVELLWRNRWIILSATLACAVLAVLVAKLSEKMYRAVIVVAPVTDTQGEGALGGLGNLAAQFGGLASLAGLSVSADSKKWESLGVLQSRALVQKYLTDKNLLPVLYEDDWDAANNRWRVSDPKKQPTPWLASMRFNKKIRKIATDNKTGLVTMTITWSDPQQASQWANDLIRLANDYLRAQVIEESERNIAYLNEQAAKTNMVEAKQAIYSILRTQINKVMLARGTDQYAFKVIDPAVPPERPSSLGAAISAVIGALVGGVLASMFLLIRAAWGRPQSR
jgi:LPS O-antigen subunit length determinant protein (WzzB/FepE family)